MLFFFGGRGVVVFIEGKLPYLGKNRVHGYHCKVASHRDAVVVKRKRETDRQRERER